LPGRIVYGELYKGIHGIYAEVNPSSSFLN
jgi:hypothetical protein